MKYIIQSTPNIIQNIDTNKIKLIEEKLKNNEQISEEEINYFLNTLCYKVRTMFKEDITDYSFMYKCDTAQAIIYYYLKKLNIKTYLCQTQNAITNMIVGHNFITIIINDKPYLIDPTYRQFFISENCSKDNYIIINNKILKTPDPGYFIKKEDENEIKLLLASGFIQLDEKTARIYGDSFLNTKVLDTLEYKTISGKVYINAFLKDTTSPSKTYEELENNNYVLTFSNSKSL